MLQNFSANQIICVICTRVKQIIKYIRQNVYNLEEELEIYEVSRRVRSVPRKKLS